MTSHWTTKTVVVGIVVIGLSAGDALGMGCCGGGGGHSARQQKSKASADAQKSQAETGKKSLAVYTCTMHPEVLSEKPGRCPKCEMTLVKRPVKKLYTCSMHPEVLSLKKGKCPKCGMKLTKRTPAKTKEAKTKPNDE